MDIWDVLLAALAIAFLGMVAVSFTRGAIARTAPAILEPHGLVPRLHVRADGTWEWYPPGQPTMYIPGVALPVHGWWDAERGPRFETDLELVISDATPPRLLRRATQRGLVDARRALPSRGKVRASAAIRDDPGPNATVKVRLAVQGLGATPEWARVASEAFAARFRREVAN